MKGQQRYRRAAARVRHANYRRQSVIGLVCAVSMAVAIPAAAVHAETHGIQTYPPQGRIAQATLADTVQFDIPAQSLDTALTALADQSGLVLLFPSREGAGLRAPSVVGSYTPEDALRRVLDGSGLTYRFTDANTVTVQKAAANGDGPMRLGDITVTARRTEELVQDVPGSVLAIPAEEIERSNITDLPTLGLRAPNVTITETGSRASSQISIRGISNLTGFRGTSPTVGVYIDEVMLNPAASTAGIDPNLIDLDRIEVLYGPQGTSFGRGTIGGALNYVTNKPTEEFEAIVDTEVGSHPDGLVRTILNGSLSGDRNLMARLVAFGQYDDGFIDTPNIGGSVDSQDYGARLNLRSQPTNRLTLDFSGSFDRTKFRAPNYATLDSIEGDGDLEFLINRDGSNRVDRSLFTFRGAYDFDVGTLTSNTSLLKIKNKTEQDLDWTQIDVFFGGLDSKEDSFGQEFRFEANPFAIPVIGKTSFLLGVNTTWYDRDLNSSIFAGNENPFTPPGTNIAPPASTEDIFDLGIFGELKFRPARKLELAVGGRFSYTDVEVSQVGLGSASKGFNAFTPKGSALYEWTDNFNTYVLVSTGYKSGGFNAFGSGPISGRSFENESAINYEGGFKSSWFDDRLFVNASAFALFYDDIQVVQVINVQGFDATAIGNAASARSIGTEVEVVALPFEGLQINLGYGYADAKFTDYEDAPDGDLTGQRLPNAPKHTLSVVGDYSYPIFPEFADAFVRAEYSYTSSLTNSSEANPRFFDAYDVVNMRIGLRAERFDIEAFVENLLNEKYITGSTGAEDIAPFLGVSEPFEVGTTRRFGARARFRF